VKVERYAESDIPTEYGVVRLVVFRADGEEHCGVVFGPEAALAGPEPVLARVHSECWTGEVLRSSKCDCRAQLDQAMRALSAAGRGVLVYLRQEGRGIGLGNKIRAYALQEQGADTVDANRMLGFADDPRTYDIAAAILAALGVSSVLLITNNPRKVEGLAAHGIAVAGRVPATTTPTEHNASYLEAKARRLGHKT
jgi:GTP cyclohydrolase II/3,4-dihydroxy 2-butanone 4-phosphate synthase/GTP cyclohydrolase II